MVFWVFRLRSLPYTNNNRKCWSY